VDQLHFRGEVEIYAYNLQSLNKKKGMSLTPLKLSSGIIIAENLRIKLLICFLALLIASFSISIANQGNLILSSCTASDASIRTWDLSVTMVALGKHFLAIRFILPVVSKVISFTLFLLDNGMVFPFAYLLVVIVYGSPLDKDVLSILSM
jgi:hypothetical protein